MSPRWTAYFSISAAVASIDLSRIKLYMAILDIHDGEIGDGSQGRSASLASLGDARSNVRDIGEHSVISPFQGIRDRVAEHVDEDRLR